MIQQNPSQRECVEYPGASKKIAVVFEAGCFVCGRLNLARLVLQLVLQETLGARGSSGSRSRALGYVTRTAGVKHGCREPIRWRRGYDSILRSLHGSTPFILQTCSIEGASLPTRKFDGVCNETRFERPSTDSFNPFLSLITSWLFQRSGIGARYFVSKEMILLRYLLAQTFFYPEGLIWNYLRVGRFLFVIEIGSVR